MQVVVGARAYELSETLQSDELAPIFADAWTASRVWDASAFLSEHLVEFAATQHHPFDMHVHSNDDNGDNGTSGDDHCVAPRSSPAAVIELGSGCGLAGLVAASLGGNVLLTDQREAVELLQRNVAANASDSERARIDVREFTWGSDPSTALPRSRFDYILVSDCINPIYGTESWRNLARSIAALSDAHTITYLSHEQRGDDAAMADFAAFSADTLVLERIAVRNKLQLSVGVFWGPEPAPLSYMPSSSSARLPPLAQSASPIEPLTCNEQLLQEQQPHGDSAAQTLQSVLQTLRQRIAHDTLQFTRHDRALEFRSASRGRERAVEREDPRYFLHDRAAKATRDVAQAHTEWARKMHCAVDDKQQYSFDRRGGGGRNAPRSSHTKRAGRGESLVVRESRAIASHQRMIEHLLHVLQQEMALETAREIQLLQCGAAARPHSRETPKQVAAIMRERYEAADRIMRILEEYKIVVGVDAAEYLRATIAHGRAMLTSS